MTAIEFAHTVTQLPTERQDALLARLRDELTEDEYNTTAVFLAVYGMYTYPEKYEALKNAVREMVCKEIFGKDDVQ